MINNYFSWGALLVCLFLIFSYGSFAQVGIGTTNPNSNAVLHISTDQAPGGVLLPNVALSSGATTTYVNAHVAGMIVYNTVRAGSGANEVTPGFYYNNGTRWVRFATGDIPDPDQFWNLEGNSVGATNFLGTTNNQSLRIHTRNALRFEFSTNGRLRSENDGSASEPTYAWLGTNGQNMGMFRSGSNGIGFSTSSTERFRIPHANQVHAMSNGTAALPFYSWQADTNMGIFRAGTDMIGFSTNATERFRVPNANQVHAMNNGTAALPFYSWQADTNMGMFRAGTDILGFSTSGNERIRVNAAGNVGVGETAPLARMHVANNNNTQPGIYAEITVNNSNWSAGEFFNPRTAGGAGVIADGAIGVSGTGRNNGLGFVGGDFYNSVNGGIGLSAGGSAGPIYMLTGSGTGGAFTGRDYGVTSIATATSDGTGVAGVGNGGTTVYTHPNGSGLAGAGNTIGVYGYATNTSGTRWGAYFGTDGTGTGNNSGGLAQVGGYYGNTRQKILGNGAMSTVVNDLNNDPVVMYAPEAPEVLFQDFGVGRMVNGVARINIDPIFSKNIQVDSQRPLKVFITLEGDCNGVYVTEKSATGFTVKELQNGTSSVEFSWQIVATRANEIFSGEISDYSKRFPPAPEEYKGVNMKTVKHEVEKVDRSAISTSKNN